MAFLLKDKIYKFKIPDAVYVFWAQKTKNIKIKWFLKYKNI